MIKIIGLYNNLFLTKILRKGERKENKKRKISYNKKYIFNSLEGYKLNISINRYI